MNLYIKVQWSAKNDNFIIFSVLPDNERRESVGDVWRCGGVDCGGVEAFWSMETVLVLQSLQQCQSVPAQQLRHQRINPGPGNNKDWPHSSHWASLNKRVHSKLVLTAKWGGECEVLARGKWSYKNRLDKINLGGPELESCWLRWLFLSESYFYYSYQVLFVVTTDLVTLFQLQDGAELWVRHNLTIIWWPQETREGQLSILPAETDQLVSQEGDPPGLHQREAAGAVEAHEVQASQRGPDGLGHQVFQGGGEVSVQSLQAGVSHGNPWWGNIQRGLSEDFPSWRIIKICQTGF